MPRGHASVHALETHDEAVVVPDTDGPSCSYRGKDFDAGEGGAGECRNASNRPLAQSYVRLSPPLADKLHCSAEVGVQCTQSTRLVMDLFVKRRQSVWHWAAPAGGTLPETQQ